MSRAPIIHSVSAVAMAFVSVSAWPACHIAANSGALSWQRRGTRMFTDSQVFNLLVWAVPVLLFALGYIAGRLR